MFKDNWLCTTNFKIVWTKNPRNPRDVAPLRRATISDVFDEPFTALANPRVSNVVACVPGGLLAREAKYFAVEP